MFLLAAYHIPALAFVIDGNSCFLASTYLCFTEVIIRHVVGGKLNEILAVLLHNLCCSSS